MKPEAAKDLFKKYQEGKCTETEKALLEQWYLHYNEQEIDIPSEKIEKSGRQIFKELPGNQRISKFIKPWQLMVATAATVLLAVGVAVLLVKTKTPAVTSFANLIVPGTNKATLTLASGGKINLNTVSNGQIAAQPGIQIIKTPNGQLIYAVSGTAKNPKKSGINNITTPKGGQWQVILPDGTKVWLNAASSFTYPTSFSQQKERIVQLSGEAYFEVAKDKAHPFIVRTDQQQVEVLGTHFNINSYKDEPTVKTTLLEGRVKVTATKNKTVKFLTPGQQALLADNNLAVIKVNPEEAIAWKNGYFRFNDEKIQSIMRKISRWYNVEVDYSGTIPNEGLNGKVSRSKNISQVLQALEATKTVHFKMEGRRVTVMK